MAPTPDNGLGLGATSPTSPPPRPELAGEDDPDDPDFEAPAPRKKKHVYRRDVQAKYRSKLKAQRAALEAALDDARLQAVALEEANSHLRSLSTALEATIAGPATHYTNVLSAARRALLPPPPPFPRASVAECIDWIFSGNIVIREADIQTYVSQPEEFMVALEHEFLDRLSTLYSAWTAGAGSRDELEQRMQGALLARIHVARALPKIPEKHLVLTKALPPPPGSPAGDAAHRALAALILELSLTPRQRLVMAEALKEYQATVEALQAEAAAAVVTLRGGAPAEAAVVEPLGYTARRILTTTHAVEVLQCLPQRMLGAYTRLAGAAFSPLSCVQAVRLLLGCRPWLPDHVQVVQLATTSIPTIVA
jgi:hypothetical protein